MFSFEGEFRRRPTQALGGVSRNTLSSRDELLQQKQDERRRRELERKKEISAIKIQTAVRGFLARRKTAATLRRLFDESTANGVDVTQVCSLMSRLLFFYESPLDDDRLHKISQVLLNKSPEVLDAVRRDRNKNWDKWLSVILTHNLRMLDSGGTSQSLVLPLRLVEIYASSSNAPLWIYLVNLDYFAILKHLVVSRCPEVNEPCDKAPTPLAESLIALVKKPLESCREFDDKCVVLRSLMRHFFGDSTCSSLDCRIFYMVLPLLAACNREVLPARALIRSALLANKDREPNTIWKLHAIATIMSRQVSTLSEQDVVNYLSVLKHFLVDLMVSSPETNELSRTSSGDFSDSEEEMDFEVNENVMKRAATESLWNLFNRDDFIQKVVWGVESVKSLEALTAISCVCYVMQARIKYSLHKCPLLCRLAFRPPFLRLLWKTVSSLKASGDAQPEATSLLHALSSGTKLSQTDARSFLPLLISFCSLFGLLLPTIYETEFYHEITADMQTLPETRSSMMPFSLGELATIAMQLRDLALGLIELSFPDGHSSYLTLREDQGSESAEDGNPEMWLALFHSVVQLLHQLYSRDCRKKFCDNWIVNTMVLPEQVTDANLKQSYLKRRPFQHLRASRDRKPTLEDPPQSSTAEPRTTAVIQELPFVIPFHTRVKIFQQLLQRDRLGRDDLPISLHMMHPYRSSGKTYNIRRTYLYEDAFQKFGSEDPPSIRSPVRVQMMNAAGVEEPGVDGGGIFREFLGELLRTSFDVNRGFFRATSDNLFYPNPSVHLIVPNFQQHYYFIGRMLGKAIYDSMLVELPLAEFFLSKLLARHNSFDLDIHHLASLDPLLYKNLLYLKSYEGDVSEMGLNFVVVNNELGEQQVVELKPNGAQIPVTEANRIEYVHLVADYKLNRQIRQQTAAFKQGLADVIDPHRLQLFDPNELQTLISGSSTSINLADWRAHTVYGIGYTAQHPVVECFWRVVASLDEDQRKQLLKFTTSCSRPPLLGFKELEPPFAINRVESPDRLPTSATCMNLLKLPEIEDFATMRSKLLYAIQSGAGFELS